MNTLNLLFGPTVPPLIGSVNLAFISAPFLRPDSAIATLSAERYAPENYSHLDTTINLFDQGVAGGTLYLQYNVPGTTFSGLVSGFNGYNLNGSVVLNSNTFGFNCLDVPMKVSGIQISKAKTWYPIIEPGLIYRLHTVTALESASSWLIRSGLKVGDTVVLIYSLPEMGYINVSDIGVEFPPSPSNYQIVKEVASPTNPNTISYRGVVNEIDSILINGVARDNGSLPWNGMGTNNYVSLIDPTTKNITLKDNISPTDFIEITYKSYSDFYVYSGYRDITNIWYPFDCNPEYGHYIGDDINKTLRSSSDALLDHATIYAIPSAYIKTNFTPTVPFTPTNLGLLNITFVRGIDWGETHFIRHTITGDSLFENIQIREGSGTNSTWGQAIFGRNYYDEQGTFETDIYSTNYPSMIPLGNVVLAAPASEDSVNVGDIRQRGGGVPINFPLVAVNTQSDGLNTLMGFYDMGNWAGKAYKEGGVAQINISKNVLKTDVNDTDPNHFTQSEIQEIVSKQIAPGIDYNILYI